jgi:hypothetical protein
MMWSDRQKSKFEAYESMRVKEITLRDIQRPQQQTEVLEL